MTPRNLCFRELLFVSPCSRKQPDLKLALCIATLHVSEGTADEKHSLSALAPFPFPPQGSSKAPHQRFPPGGSCVPRARLPTPAHARVTPLSSAVTPSSIAPHSAGASV